MDGTFSQCPRLFSQIYVIRVQLRDFFITAVYVFMTNKSQQLYNDMFTILQQYGLANNITLNPEIVMTDFELAPRRAINDVFGHQVEMKACYFHLTQSSWRKIAELGLSNVYKNDENVRHFVGMVNGLAFLPIADLEEGLLYLYANIPGNDNSIQNFLTYFDEIYCRGKFRAVPQNNAVAVMLRRSPPLFPPNLWNVFEATINGDARTNNVCEGWNHSFANMVGHANPSIWTVIKSFQADRALAIDTARRIENGQPPTVRTKRHTAGLQGRLRNICMNLNNGVTTVPLALRAIGHCIFLTRLFN